MHFFFSKGRRVFHKANAVGQWLVDGFGLTPARYDMMYAIRHHWRNGRIVQSVLREVLGVAAQTVSKMVGALEKLGLVVRTKGAYGDKRQREVALTAEGKRRIEAATAAMNDDGDVDQVVAAVVSREPLDAGVTFQALEAIEESFRVILSRTGDQSSLHYAWHPEDCLGEGDDFYWQEWELEACS